MFALQDAIVEANLFLEPVEFSIVRSSHGPWLASEKTRVRPFMPAASVMESSESAWNDSKTAHRILFTR